MILCVCVMLSTVMIISFNGAWKPLLEWVLERIRAWGRVGWVTSEVPWHSGALVDERVFPYLVQTHRAKVIANGTHILQGKKKGEREDRRRKRKQRRRRGRRREEEEEKEGGGEERKTSVQGITTVILKREASLRRENGMRNTLAVTVTRKSLSF